MVKRLRLDGKDYDVSQLSEAGRRTLVLFQHTTKRLEDMENTVALLTKARNAYLVELRAEIIQGRTGVELGALFDD